MCDGGAQPRNHMCMPGFVVCTLCSSNNAFTSVPWPWFYREEKSGLPSFLGT